jgi:hypothetical protein
MEIGHNLLRESMFNVQPIGQGSLTVTNCALTTPSIRRVPMFESALCPRHQFEMPIALRFRNQSVVICLGTLACG